MNDIKLFRKTLYESIGKEINSKGFKYKSTKSAFEQKTPLGTNTIVTFVEKHDGYFSVSIKCYFTSSTVEKLLKVKDTNYKKSYLIGGDLKLLFQEYSSLKWPYRYSEIVHEFNQPVETLTIEILGLLEKCAAPFFLSCESSQFLNNSINDHPIESVGLAITYKNRVTKGLLVAKLAGLSREEIEKIANQYEAEIAKENLPYLNEFKDFRKDFGFI